MHIHGGMDGVISSEESERSHGSEGTRGSYHSNATQGTVLRRTVARGSTRDLLDFGSEDSGVVLVVPLVPVMRCSEEERERELRGEGGKRELGEHVEELLSWLEEGRG